MLELLVAPSYKREIHNSLITDVFNSPGSLGNFVSTGDIEHDYFESVQDGNPVVRTYNNFTINEGHVVTPTNRCKGLYLNILGDLTVNGTLSMTARGCVGEGCNIGIDYSERVIYYASENIFPDDFTVIGPVGGLGIVGPRCSDAVNNACGSGGGAGEENSGVRGGNGTCFSGGSGAGGGCSYHSGRSYARYYGYAGNDNGGAGGDGYYHGGNCAAYGGGGGAGNPGGTCRKQSSRNGQNGTGGLLILFCNRLVLGENGKIESNGSNGGDGEKGRTDVRYASRVGSGSGGGAIHIFYKQIIGNINNITANGGKKGICPNEDSWSSDGGNGTINLVKM